MIDRGALVHRHCPRIDRLDPLAPVHLGNGEFAVTVDVTGLQSLPEAYAPLPLVAMANWAWHTAPSPEGYDRPFPPTLFSSHGRQVPYLYTAHPWWKPDPDPHAQYLARNPHHFNLGRLGLLLDGAPLAPGRIEAIDQRLDLWTGLLTSRFRLDGEAVTVLTVCDPEQSGFSLRVESGLLMARRLGLSLYFPYGSHVRSGGEDGRDGAHITRCEQQGNAGWVCYRGMDDLAYTARLKTGPCSLSAPGPHRFHLHPKAHARQWEVGLVYSQGAQDASSLSFEDTRLAAARHWAAFWMAGGAVELAGSADPRWMELERRLVLSQYLTAIQSCGSLPPQESGLMHNSWNGKFHLEMHYWHAAHFALWGRPHLLENSLAWYMGILPRAKALAAGQGYEGARWPKCVGPDGVNAPCSIEPFLVWQQPHPIYYAELLYRALPRMELLRRYAPLVFETADFMASFAVFRESDGRYVLGPPVAPAQERYDHVVTMNPTYELSYWRWGLATALEWYSRMGKQPDPRLRQVLENLAPLPQQDGVYLAAETAPDTFHNPDYLKDHPTMAASLGLLPGPDVSKDVMARTLDLVDSRWDWRATWGWDYPMLAMCAARLGQPERAIDYLFRDTPKNRWLPLGGNYQAEVLPAYLPGNGGLLLAIAMMATGWDGDSGGHAPGFPKTGWVVRHENLNKMP